jgi:hypothetical protein
MQSTHYLCQILIELQFSRHIFEKNPQISNLMKTHPVGAEMFMWMDRHDEVNTVEPLITDTLINEHLQ